MCCCYDRSRLKAQKGLILLMFNKKIAGLNCTVLPVLCLLLLLSACADVTGPQWLTGEPGPEKLSNKRVVRKPQNETDVAWPRLADVPEEKPVFSSQSQRAANAQELKSDQLQADAEKERLQNIDLYGTGLQPLDQSEPFSFSALKP